MLFPEIKKVLFIQGLLGMHMRYRGGYLDVKDNKYNKGAPFRSRIITDLRTFFYNKQVEYEKDTITNCNNVIIDNEFSEAYCTSISPNVVCYKKFLSADNVFFNEKWNFDRCEPNSIFTVYGFSADKGLHQLLKAMVIVKRSFPNVKLYIPGSFNCDNKGKLTVESIRTEYEHWIFNFIKENNLEENIVFLGKLDRTQMCQHILKSNIFVNPSCMEVHALSLREAMTVGIPCISSLCGSVIEYVNHEENGLIYRYEEYEILAFYINKLLSDTDYAKKLAANARNHMLNIKANGKNNLFKIYNNIVYDVNL